MVQIGLLVSLLAMCVFLITIYYWMREQMRIVQSYLADILKYQRAQMTKLKALEQEVIDLEDSYNLDGSHPSTNQVADDGAGMV